MRAVRGALVGFMFALLVTGCSAEPSTPTDRPPPNLSDCAPLELGDVRGQAPAYLPEKLSGFTNDDAMCAGRWLPRLARDFTPQGIAVRGDSVWVSGNDGGGGQGRLYCWVLRMDRRSGSLLGEERAFPAPDGIGAPCRHGGGLELDEHGLWLSERVRLWLLDPETLQPMRTWRLERPVQGSFAVLDDQGRIGLGDFHPTRSRGAGRLHWFDLDRVLATGTEVLDPDNSSGRKRLPDQVQGALWARMGTRSGLWLHRSTTRCGILSAPGGRQLATVPGAEGMVLVGHELWVVSESTARPYFTQGGRPVVPSITVLDMRRVDDWEQADCGV